MLNSSIMYSRTVLNQYKILRRLTKHIQNHGRPSQNQLHCGRPAYRCLYNRQPIKNQLHLLTPSCVLINCITSKHHYLHEKDGLLSCSPLWTQNNTLILSSRNLTRNSKGSDVTSAKHISNFHKNSKLLLATNKQWQQDRQLSLNTKKILEASPTSVQPYLRLIRFDKPIGSFLLFWPCTWSIGLATEAGHLPDLYILTLFGMGAFLMRGAGCIINDMWDKDIDRKVERTKMRPLASGELSPFQGLLLLATNLSLSLGILLQLNWYSVFLGASSMLLVIAYPLAKRYTYWPQLMLGLTFNFGAILGWCAVKGVIDWPVIPLYSGCIVWTLIYDTIYAHQDKYDDMLIGVKSSALRLGDQTKPWLAGFTGVMVTSLALAGHMCDQTWPFYTALTGTALHLSHQLYTVDLDNPDSCFSKFKSNSQLGALMFFGIVLGTLMKTDKPDKEKAE